MGQNQHIFRRAEQLNKQRDSSAKKPNNKNYLICYDISDPKRLAKLARYLAKKAFRIQNSIFLLPKANSRSLEEIIEGISSRIDSSIDDVRIYTIINSGLRSEAAVDLDCPFVLS